MPIYEFGSTAAIEATFVDFSTGLLKDPTALSMRIYHYDNTVLLEVLPASPMVKVGTGRYVSEIPISAPLFDIGEQYFTEFSGYVDLIPATAASITGTGVEDFNIQTGINDSFSFKLDGGSTIPVVLTPGTGLHAQITGTSTEDFTFITDAPARDIGSTLGPFTIISGVNDELRVSVDGELIQIITIPAGVNRTVGELVNDINAQITGILASNNGGNLQLASNSLGANSRLFIGGGSINSTVGFVTDSTFLGQDNNLTLKVTIDDGGEQTFTFTPGTMNAAQVVSLINDTAVDFQASNSVGSIKLTNISSEIGLRSVINIGVGTASETLGFVKGSTIRGVPGRLAQDVADEINAAVGVGTPATVLNGSIVLTSPKSGSSSSIQILTGNANPVLGFVPNQLIVGSNVLTENFLQVQEFLVVEQLAPKLEGLSVSFIS